MKNVYLANFSMTINPGNHKFLPYSVAGLWSYAEQDEQVKNNYQLAGLYYEKKDIDEIVNEIVSLIWESKFELAMIGQIF